MKTERILSFTTLAANALRRVIALAPKRRPRPERLPEAYHVEVPDSLRRDLGLPPAIPRSPPEVNRLIL